MDPKEKPQDTAPEEENLKPEADNEPQAAEETPEEQQAPEKTPLELAEEKAAEYLAMAQRVQADFENFRRRNESVRADSFAEGKRRRRRDAAGSGQPGKGGGGCGEFRG